MKKYICLAVALALTATLLSGCVFTDDQQSDSQPYTTKPSTVEVKPSQTATTTPSQPTTTPKPEPLVYTWTNVPSFDAWANDAPATPDYLWIINSVEGIGGLADYLTYESTQGETLEGYMSAYDSTFFNGHTLIVVRCVEQFSGAKHVTTDFVKNADGTYLLKVEPVYGWNDHPAGSYSVMLIEVAEKIPEDAVIVVEGFDHP